MLGAMKMLLTMTTILPIRGELNSTHHKNDQDILSQLNWVEAEDENGPVDMDIYFDRAVFVTLSDNKPIAPGVFVTPNIVLTSYNPFRPGNIAGNEMPTVVILTGRIMTEVGEDNKHETHIAKAACARQVVPVPEEEIAITQWHGTDKTHSPLHDLMVLRIDDVPEFLDPDPNKYSFSNYYVGASSYTAAGPMVTNIATPSDKLDKNVKFASLGFLNKRHILQSKVLSSRSYEEEENVLEDCLEWFPKSWGYFICISNVDHYKGVGSGALLIHNDMLYGVGSFLLKKSNQSILVFTDVRPYNFIIFNTCAGEIPTSTTTTTEAATDY